MTTLPKTEVYAGPCTLAEALAACPPHPALGLRVAVSVPDGTHVAVQMPDGSLIVRSLAQRKGWRSSVTGTGEWWNGAGADLFEWRPG